jgi:hypothetical protein
LAQSEQAEPILQWRSAVSIVAFNSTNKVQTTETELRAALERLMLGHPPAPVLLQPPTSVASLSDDGTFRLMGAVPVSSLHQKCFDDALCALWFDDTGDKPPAEFQAEWQELLRMNNLLQFAPRFVSFTRNMVSKGLVANAIDWLMEGEAQQDTQDSTSALSEEQMELLELLDPSLQPVLIPLLKEAAIPWPEFGYEAIDEQGRCGNSMLELAWPEKSIGIALPPNDIEDFLKAGWTVLLPADLDADTLQALFNPKS